jgi:O-antigen/teichoic acid export membrane protein
MFSTAIGELIGSLLHIFAFISLVNWLINPYKDFDYGDAYCSMAKHIILCLFTCGIWPLIWIYRITKYLNKAPNSEYYNPTSKLLLCIFIPFYQIYWFYKHGQRTDSISQSKNSNSNMATLCLILAIFVPFIAIIILQDKINQLSIMESQEKENSYEPEQEIELAE